MQASCSWRSKAFISNYTAATQHIAPSLVDIGKQTTSKSYLALFLPQLPTPHFHSQDSTKC